MYWVCFLTWQINSFDASSTHLQHWFRDVIDLFYLDLTKCIRIKTFSQRNYQSLTMRSHKLSTKQLHDPWGVLSPFFSIQIGYDLEGLSICLPPKCNIFIKEKPISFCGWDLFGDRLFVELKGHFAREFDLHFDCYYFK